MQAQQKPNRFEGCTKGFIHHNPMYFGMTNPPGVVDQIEFGFFGTVPGGHSHVHMVWLFIPDRAPFARLEALFDSWATLAAVTNVLDALVPPVNDRHYNITPDEFKELLKKCGFADYTDYVNEFSWEMRGRADGGDDPTDL
jgi:hypothetical protein